jgi:HD-like signal output (HDOD) protein
MTAAAIRDQDDENDELTRRLRFILQAGDFPALSKLFMDAMSISADGDSSQRLANLVLRDYSLTVKVIRTANTLHYNRTGKPIRSATHAMLLLGVRTVRDLATSLILFEHYQRKSPGLKELMLLSMLSATHAREMAAKLGLPEPEEAHLCGMFRNLGEVLVAAHFPEDYARILQKARDIQAQACGKPNAEANIEASVMESATASVLGFTYEDLGTAVARHWGMPESVTETIRAKGPSSSRTLIGVVTFSHELTTSIYRDEATRGAFKVADAMRRHGPALGIDQSEVGTVLERAVSETKDVFANARVSLDDLRLRKQTAEALRVLGGGAVDTPAGGTTASDSAESIADLRQRLAQEAESALAPDRGYGLEAVVLILLEALMRGGPFSRVVFAITNAERTMVEARLGLGDGVDGLIAKLRVSTRSAPVSLAVEWRRVAMRTVERALTGDEAKWCAVVGASAFGVAPLTVDGKLVGCLYADCVGACDSTEAAAPFLEAIAGLASRAIASRRSAPATRSASESATDRAAAVLRVLRGESAAVVAAECGVAESVVEEWKRAFLEGAVRGLSGQ